MPAPNPIYTGKPFSLAHMRRVFAMSDPVKLAAMTPLMPWDYFYRAYDFNEPTLNTDWTANVTGAATAFAYNAQRNAALRGATGATNGDVTELVYGSVIFDSADSPFMWVRFVSPAAVTSFAFEIGFSDPHTAATMGMTALTDATPPIPTIQASYTDIAAVAMDTSDARTTATLIADGTTGTPTGVSITNDAGTAWTPTASALIDVIVGIRANVSYCWVWDSQAPVGVMRSVAQGPDSGVLLAPYMLFRTRNTTSKQVDLLKCVLVSEENRTS